MIRTTLTVLLTATFLMVAGSAMAADGASVYASKCAMCHGKDASGGAMAPALKGTEFIGGDAADIEAVVKEGRAGADKLYKQFPTPMPPFGSLTDDEVSAVVEYLKGL